MARKRSMVGQRMMLGLIFILVACYTLYHLAGFFDTEMKTYAAGVTAEVKAVGGAGYLFRDETVLTASFGGVVDYQVENGVKVGEGKIFGADLLPKSQGIENDSPRIKTLLYESDPSVQ